MNLPVASAQTLRARTVELARRHRRALAWVVVLHGLAAAAGLLGPWLLGTLVDAVVVGTSAAAVDGVAVVLLAAVLAQTVLTRWAQRGSMTLGETVFADLREEFVAGVTALPLSVVEQAGTGDLLARTTNDVDRVQYTVRFGVPRVVVAVATVLLTVVAAVLVSPALAPAMLAGAPLLVVVSRWYLRRARPAYLREAAAYARLGGSVTESVEGARTVDALGLGARRRRRVDADVDECVASERASLRLRTVLFPAFDLSFVVPLVVVLAWGAHLVGTGTVAVGDVATVALYTVALAGPVGELIFWLDEIQVGATALARITGVRDVAPDRAVGTAAPRDERVAAESVRYAYRTGHDVLHDVDLRLRPGERLAVVGPSGAGKSTLGRLLAGVHPPGGGRVTVGDVPLVELPLDDLRGHVALVTQEHHVFVGTVADNLRLAAPAATDAGLWRALGAVDAARWVAALPDGLATAVGSGGIAMTPAQAQQLALARLVLLDPHTLVLDEATSLLDPTAARHLERSLSGVLAGRTVVAIAHRLHTAHDADRVAVVQAGRIAEIGPHDELVAAGGEYAALWRSWHG